MAASLAALLILTAAAPVPSGTIAIADGSDLSFGGAVTFDVTYDGLRGRQYPMVYVECFQDVKVWGRLGSPDYVFTLGGASSLWVARGGGPAECFASLRAYGSGGARYLAEPIAFHADG